MNPAADQQNASVAPGDGGEQPTPGVGAVPTGAADDSIADVTVPAVGGNDAVPAEDAGSSSNVQAQKVNACLCRHFSAKLMQIMTSVF